MSDKKSIQKGAFIATIAILGSRIFGLVREQVFAFFFGASFVMDAFIAAFRIPNLLRDLFAEGALSQSFVAIFSQKSQESDEEAYKLANRVLGFVIILLAVIVILGIIFSPQLVSLIATGFEGEKFILTTKLNRILFPFIFFVSMASVLMGMLNAKHKFFIPQSASTFFNISSILVGLACLAIFEPRFLPYMLQKMNGEPVSIPNSILSNAIMYMAVGTLTGGFVQFFIQLFPLYKLNFKFKPRFDFKDSAFINVLKLTGPAIIGGAAVQVNVMINTWFASYLADGSIAYLNFAFRLMQFPLGVFGVAVAVASAPTLAKLVTKNDETQLKKILRSSLQMSLFLSIPSTVGLFLLSKPIITLIYQHGQFSNLDTLNTAHALMAYSLGITAYSLIKIYQPAFLAYHDAKTPMRISLFSIILNFSINWLLIKVLHWPHWGLALGTACVALLNFSLLSFFFRKKLSQVWDQNQFQILFKILLSCGAMTFYLWTTNAFFMEKFIESSFLLKVGFLFMQIGFASLIYFLMANILKVNEAKVLVDGLKRKLRR